MKPKLVATLEADEPMRRLAVLIDADNAQASISEELFAEIARLGDATVRRIYGDFTVPTSAQWRKQLQQFAIKPVQQFAYTSGKNATDSTLIIDAMDLLYTGRFDGFCIVSSDSDFTGLATRLRESGAVVYGFGEQKTPEAFRKACNRFIFTEVLRPLASTPATTDITKPQSTEQAASQESPKALVGEPIPEEIFRQALEQVSDESGWASLALFGSQLSKIRPDFDARNFGHKKLSDLVRAYRHLFQVEERGTESGSGKVLYIRLQGRQR